MATILKSPLSWIAVLVAGFMALVTTLSYLGGFLNPAGNMRDMPLAVSNEDRSVTINGRTLNLGEQLVQSLNDPAGPLAGSFKWTLLPARADVVAGLANGRYYGAIVIPADYSQRLAAMTSPAALESAAPAQLEVLTSPAAGSIAGAESQAALLGVVGQASKAAREQALAAARAANATLSPGAVSVLSDPVRATVTVAQPVGPRSARGLSPFYFAVVLTISAFIGANLLDRGALFVTGREEFDLFHRTLVSPRTALSRQRQWFVRCILAVPMSLAVAGAVTWTAVSFLDMDAPQAWGLFAFALLGVLAVALVTLFFNTAFGTPGLLLGVLFTTILGVPSAGGVYPPEMLPRVFQVLGDWLTLPYMTTGARALLFFDGNGGAGLNRAVAVLLAYVAGSVAAGWGAAAFIDWLRRGAVPAPAEGAAPRPESA